MKQFPFSFRGQGYHLRKMSQDTKDDLLDRITAKRLKQAARMHKKGYLDPGEYLEAKQAAYVKWGTEAFHTELCDDDNAAAFVRAIVVESLDDATVAELVKEQRKEDSEMVAAISLMAEDDDPKPQPPTA